MIYFRLPALLLMCWQLAVASLSFRCYADDREAGAGHDDPYLWLEEVESERALNWVRHQNETTLTTLQGSSLYLKNLADARAILFAKDKVPFSNFSTGYFWNFWQDEHHVHGVIRRTTYDEYQKAEPHWETILDLDQLSAAEGENWVYVQRTKLGPKSSRWLIHLSRGGKDATVVREFDVETREFVSDGFNLPEAKTSVIGLDQDTVLVGTDFGANSLTTSGYPRMIKLWHRGESLKNAKKVFEVAPGDLETAPLVIRHGSEVSVLFIRQQGFFDKSFYLSEVGQPLRKLPLPESAELIDIRGGQIYAQLKNDLSSGITFFRSGAIIRLDLHAQSLEHAQLVFQPEKGQSIQSVAVAQDRLFINLLENVRSRVLELTDSSGRWTIRTLPFPDSGVISFKVKDDDDPTAFSVIQYEDHLTPSRQYRVHDEGGRYGLELLKSGPSRFDSDRFEVVQDFASSTDGTRIPYFLIKEKSLAYDGSNPTILYGYGGFDVSLTPHYLGVIGKLWLEPGRVYVIANIRGGGEFGPEWHQAALRQKRQVAFDDFAAVASDLIAKKITSPAHLGINGVSNGGLLTGTVMVQRPDLFNAALIQVPLLDMLRYASLLAGASWIGEYGNPENPGDREYLANYSPYANVRADRTYPVPLFTTSTKDDRVHPAHARKMVARMLAQGHHVFYYENVNGGHAGSANLEESANMTALEYTYFCERLLAKK